MMIYQRLKMWATAFVVCMAVFASATPCSASAPAGEVNEKPFVIPELREWQGDQGMFSLGKSSRIVATDKELLDVAKQLSADYELMFGKKMKATCGTARPGDIELSLATSSSLGEEGYILRITDRITMQANAKLGLYWGTRTLLQIWEQNEGTSIPCGTAVDYPDYPLRGFSLDCARKFIPMSYLRKLTAIMSYYKMNTLQVHLNDNGFPKYFNNKWEKTYAAFRMESELFPELTAKDGHYGKKEFRDFQLEAAGRGVTIIPEIDVPAHSLAFAHFRDELGSTEYGKDHLDLFNPNLYGFIDSLFTEYIAGPEPVFVGERVHVGTDEYSNKKKEVVEKFREFTDHCIRLVEKHGKKAAVWGALTHAKGDTPVKSEDVLMSLWYNGYAQPADMIEQGYDLISINDGHTYIVPAAGYYYDYLNLPFLYNKWKPSIIGGATFMHKHPQIKGGMFAVWNDVVGNGISVKDVHHRAYPAIQVISAKSWNAEDQTVPFETFDQKRQTLSEAPGINELGRIGKQARTMVYAADIVKAGRTLPYEEIGYDYTVSFDIEYAAEERGTILFASENAVVYLSDPISGMMGFARDGYLNNFTRNVRPGVKENIRIEGDNKATRLYVNGKLVCDLDYEKRYNNDKSSYNYLSTLVFPLRQAGDFNSKVTNLKVYNYCLSK